MILWNICYETDVMKQILWKSCYGRDIMEELSWNSCYGILVMAYLLWHTCYGMEKHLLHQKKEPIKKGTDKNPLCSLPCCMYRCSPVLLRIIKSHKLYKICCFTRAVSSPFSTAINTLSPASTWSDRISFAVSVSTYF